jgi:hypothetical protein
MKIPTNAIGDRDFNAYFEGCFLRDPISKKPARFVRAGPGINFEWPLSFTLELAGDDLSMVNGELVTYQGEQTKDFYDTRLYNGYKLGYRSFDKGKKLLYLYQIPARIGSRGISARRLGAVDDPITDTVFGAMSKIKINYETIQGAKLIIDPAFISINDGIKAMLEGELASAAVNPDIALVISSSEDAEEFPIHLMYRQMNAGKVKADGTLDINPEYQEFIMESLNAGA